MGGVLRAGGHRLAAGRSCGEAVLQRLRLPRRLVTILEGESLVNDASGLLLYRFAVAAALTGTFDAAEASLSFVWLAIGGTGLGFLTGWLVLKLLRRHGRPHEAVLITFLAGWVAYLLADLVSASGVLAVVTCGLVLGRGQHSVLSARARTDAFIVWRFVVTLLESFVFVLRGLSLRGVLERFGGLAEAWASAGNLAMAVVATVIVARMMWVYPATYLPRWFSARLRARDPSPPASVPFIIGWAGMRGVVSLAAALALPLQFPGRDLLLFASFVVIAVTVLVQGTTLGPLLRFIRLERLSMGRPNLRDVFDARARVVAASLAAVEGFEARRQNGNHPHPQLLEEYRRRAQITARVRDAGGVLKQTRREHFMVSLECVDAGRRELLRMHETEEIHDSVLHEIEAELDLEEIRLKHLAGQTDE